MGFGFGSILHSSLISAIRLKRRMLVIIQSFTVEQDLVAIVCQKLSGEFS